MTTLLTEPGASALLVVDEVGGATLTEIARATGRPTSTIQRAIEGLVGARVLVREAPRGRLHLAVGAPRRALRELAEWRLGSDTSQEIRRKARANLPDAWLLPPSTVSNASIRAAWPEAIRAITTTFQPRQVILFGSQARGDARPDSDVDLLVVFDRPIDHRAEQIKIRKLLRDAPFAKDILVRTTDDLVHVARGTAVAAALKDGVVVYER